MAIKEEREANFSFTFEEMDGAARAFKAVRELFNSRCASSPELEKEVAQNFRDSGHEVAFHLCDGHLFVIERIESTLNIEQVGY